MNNILYWIVIILCSTLIIYVSMYLFYFVQGLLLQRSPLIATFGKTIQLMKEKLKLKKGSSLIDLGCGSGKTLRFFFDYYELDCYGVDINLYAIITGRIKNFFLKKKIPLYHNDFYNVDISGYDYIYIFLLPKEMNIIEDRIFATKKHNAIVIVNTFAFKKHTAFSIISDGKNKIYLYK